MTRKNKLGFALVVAASIALLFGAFASSAATANDARQPLEYDVYLKLDGIDGEGTAKGYEKWIPLTSVRLGVTTASNAAAGGSGRGKASATPVVVTKRPDAASVPLFLATANGTFIKKGVIAFVSRGEAPRTVLSYELNDVAIASYEADNAFETLELSYSALTIAYSAQKPDGSGSPPIKGGFNFAKNAKL